MMETECHLSSFGCEVGSTSIRDTSTAITTSTTLVSAESPVSVKVEPFDCETNHLCYQDFTKAPSISKSNDRDARNKAEKMRRNKLNAHITELSEVIPTVILSSRKIDKTGILRLAANDLRKDHVFGNSIKCCHMDIRPSSILSLLDHIGGFLITITCKGVITILSPNVQNYLGHCKLDLLGQNLYALIHPDDRQILKRHVYPPELQMDPVPQEVFNRKSEFIVRIMRATPRSEPMQYEVCKIDGNLRRSDKAASCSVRDDQVIRRQRVRRDRKISSSGNDVVFVGFVKLLPKVKVEPTLLVSYHLEYWTRHLIDGRIVQCDQRISLVAGYLTEEITGVSGFTFMHKDDVRWVVIALRQMYDHDTDFGESCYRLLSRTGEFIYLKTRGFLEIDERTKVVQSFVCVNNIVSEEEGQILIEEMKRKYSALVNIGESCFETEPDSHPIEDPSQLEQVIMHLVSTIPNSEENIMQKPVLRPPEPMSIKEAIEKSVAVVNKSVNGLRMGYGNKRPSCDDSDNDMICAKRVAT